MNKIALVLSFIFPGLGQIWNREYMKGINFAILQIIFIFVVFYPDSTFFPIGMIAIPVLWVWSMVDASWIYSYPRKRKQRRKIRLTLGIIAFWVLSEAVFSSIVLIIKHNQQPPLKVHAEFKSELSEVPSEEPNGKSSDTFENSSSNSEYSLSLSKFTSNLSKKNASNYENTTPTSSKAPSPFTSPEGKPWVVTAGISEKYSEINRLYLDLRKKYKVQIIPVSSNPKQNVYAVVITDFATILDAKNTADELRKEIPNCFVAFYENPAKSIDTYKLKRTGE